MTSTQRDRKAEMRTASVYYGDCLKHLTHWNNWNQWRQVGREEAVRRMQIERKLADLIYLDPPWNSNEDYNVTYETPENKELGFTAQATAFTDTWEWGDAANDRLPSPKSRLERNEKNLTFAPDSAKSRKKVHIVCAFVGFQSG